MITPDDFLLYVDDALAQIGRLLDDLGDDLANRRLDVEGANSPFAVATHCLGVMEFWGGHAIAGRRIRRDRDAEFVAHGRVTDLHAAIDAARARLRADLASFDGAAPPRGELPLDPDDPATRTQGAVLVHIYEELAQHLGQMEVTADVIRAVARGERVTTSGTA